MELLELAVNNNQPCIVRELIERHGVSSSVSLCQRPSRQHYSFPGCRDKVYRRSRPKYVRVDSQRLESQTTDLVSIFARYGNQDFVEYLLDKHGTSCLFSQNNEVLISAARSGNSALFSSLCQQGADPRIRSDSLARAAKRSGNAKLVAEVETRLL
jgi:ankyrin repeat protein